MAAFGGNGGVATHGQLFTAPSANYLNSFTLIVDEFRRDLPVRLRGYVLPWSNNRAQLPALFESEIITTDGVRDTWETLEFDTGGIELIAGQPYVLFIGMYGLYAGPDAALKTAIRGPNDDPYPQGLATHTGSAWTAPSLAQTDNVSWSFLSIRNSTDLAFRAEFSTEPIPEPKAFVLLLTASLVFLRRVRSRA